MTGIRLMMVSLVNELDQLVLYTPDIYRTGFLSLTVIYLKSVRRML
jgi:hypothetical protein